MKHRKTAPPAAAQTAAPAEHEQTPGELVDGIRALVRTLYKQGLAPTTIAASCRRVIDECVDRECAGATLLDHKRSLEAWVDDDRPERAGIGQAP